MASAKIIWIAGPRLDDIATHPSKYTLMSGEKFSDWDRIEIIGHYPLSCGYSSVNKDGEPAQVRAGYDIDKWKLYSKLQMIPPVRYLSDTEWFLDRYEEVQFYVSRLIGVKEIIRSKS